MKWAKGLNIFLGVVSFLFGVLKFFSPFKDGYAVQIYASGLPPYTYAGGIAAEIITGIVFLLPFLLPIDDNRKRLLLILANCSMIIIMVTATSVHLMPLVPAEVLPLDIKPPVIPLLIMAIAIFNLVTIYKFKRI